MQELSIMNTQAIRQRHMNGNIANCISEQIEIQDNQVIRRTEQQKQLRSALLVGTISFMVCALFIIYWVVFGY